MLVDSDGARLHELAHGCFVVLASCSCSGSTFRTTSCRRVLSCHSHTTLQTCKFVPKICTIKVDGPKPHICCSSLYLAHRPGLSLSSHDAPDVWNVGIDLVEADALELTLGDSEVLHFQNLALMSHTGGTESFSHIATLARNIELALTGWRDSATTVKPLALVENLLPHVMVY